jgi:phage recombination protein Bet
MATTTPQVAPAAVLAPFMTSPEVTIREAEVALIRQIVAPSLTYPELAAFFRECHRRGVHPLDKLIIPTAFGSGDRRRLTFITTIDYLRSRADATGLYCGNDDAEFDEDDNATVTVWKLVQGQRCAFTATARIDEYAQDSPTWKRMKRTMIAKCAEALALRKAFPQQLGGLYTRDEMEQAAPAEGLVIHHPAEPVHHAESVHEPVPETTWAPASLTPYEVGQVTSIKGPSVGKHQGAPVQRWVATIAATTPALAQTLSVAILDNEVAALAEEAALNHLEASFEFDTFTGKAGTYSVMVGITLNPLDGEDDPADLDPRDEADA